VAERRPPPPAELLANDPIMNPIPAYKDFVAADAIAAAAANNQHNRQLQLITWQAGCSPAISSAGIAAARGRSGGNGDADAWPVAGQLRRQ
jgi:hypothetical protein